MNFQELLTEGKKNKLLLLDIDDTIVKAKNIYIYKNINGQEIKLTPEQFSHEKVTLETERMYDFRDFRNAEKIASSISTGEPIIKVLKYMDNMISKGYKVGILTARGMEDVIKSTIASWLMYKKRGELKSIGSKLKEVFAVGDDIKKYKGATSFERKANVIKSLSANYDKITFVDDDSKNVQAVRNLNIHNVKVKNVNEIED